MNCECCGFTHKEAFPVCPACGQWTFHSPAALPAPDKKRAMLPYLLMTAMVLLGIVLFFLIPMTPADSPSVSENDLPSEGQTLFQKDCFLLDDTGTVRFDKTQFRSNPVIIVPAAIEDQPVLAIADGCFENVEGVTTVILPSSITRIGERAFAGCRDLRGLCLPNGVLSVGASAFEGCKSLEAVYIPTALDNLGQGAFEDCPRLQFIFYNGLYAQWIKLYPEVITPFTWVICWDGEYQHTGKNP